MVAEIYEQYSSPGQAIMPLVADPLKNLSHMTPSAVILKLSERSCCNRDVQLIQELYDFI